MGKTSGRCENVWSDGARTGRRFQVSVILSDAEFTRLEELVGGDAVDAPAEEGDERAVHHRFKARSIERVEAVHRAHEGAELDRAGAVLDLFARKERRDGGHREKVGHHVRDDGEVESS